MIEVNGKEIVIEKFPNGEKKVKEFSVHGINYIVMKWQSDEDLINLMFVRDYMSTFDYDWIDLTIPYFPYSRMDRKIDGDLFTLKSVCNFINYLNFNAVITYDNHSDVTTALLDRCINESKTRMLFDEIPDEIDYIFYPDAGAQKRFKIEGFPYLIGHKERNEQTGRIEKYDVIGNIAENYGNVCIVDDLSSYGGTFLLASRELKKLGADKIFLVVTHCEEVILKGDIFKEGNIDLVLTTDSIISADKSFDKLIIKEI